jgi:hypothetical protein
MTQAPQTEKRRRSILPYVMIAACFLSMVGSVSILAAAVIIH